MSSNLMSALFLLTLLLPLANAKNATFKVSPFKGAVEIEKIGRTYDKLTVPISADRKTMTLEGKIERKTYWLGKKATPLEVFRNYEKAYRDRDFQFIYSGTGKKGVGTSLWIPSALGMNSLTCYSWAPKTTHYLVVKKVLGGRSVHHILYISECRSDKPKNRTYVPKATRVFMWTVEQKVMQMGRVKITVAYLEKQLAEQGHVALKGIEFDFNSAKLRPVSIEILKQVAALMRKKPKLSLYVVGHTDMEGTLEYNRKLSRERAAAVVQWLASAGKTRRARLRSFGLGPLAPIASNRTPTGRAKNRRVELVEIK